MEENAKALALWKSQKEEAAGKLLEEMNRHKEKMEKEREGRKVFMRKQREQIVRGR